MYIKYVDFLKKKSEKSWWNDSVSAWSLAHFFVHSIQGQRSLVRLLPLKSLNFRVYCCLKQPHQEINLQLHTITTNNTTQKKKQKY